MVDSGVLGRVPMYVAKGQASYRGPYAIHDAKPKIRGSQAHRARTSR
jgi:hypothetical protein